MPKIFPALTSVLLISAFVIVVPHALAERADKGVHHLKSSAIKVTSAVPVINTSVTADPGNQDQSDQNSTDVLPAPASIKNPEGKNISSSTSHRVATTTTTTIPAAATSGNKPPTTSRSSQTVQTTQTVQTASVASSPVVSAPSQTSTTAPAQSSVVTPDLGSIYTRPTNLPLSVTLGLLVTALGLCVLGAYLIAKDSPEAYRVALIPNAYGGQQSLA